MARTQWLRGAAGIVWRSGAACSALAALVFSMNALFVKLLHNHIPVFEIALVRSLLSLAVCGAIARNQGIKPFWGHRASLPRLLSRGVFGVSADQFPPRMVCFARQWVQDSCPAAMHRSILRRA